MALIALLRKLRLRWQVLTLMLKLRGRPVFAGADGASDGDGGDGGGGEGEHANSDSDNEGGGADGVTAKSAEDLRKELRESDRVRKRESANAKKTIADLEQKLKDREDADKSDHEKAVEEARKAARDEALGEAEKDRRRDRLEVAATRLAVKGIETGEGDDKATVRFADPDDALIYVERAISAGDADADEIFDAEGKVQTGPLAEVLKEILERKPHLRAGASGKPDDRKPKGSADAGRGSGGGKNLDEMSVEDHFKSVSRTGSSK